MKSRPSQSMLRMNNRSLQMVVGGGGGGGGGRGGDGKEENGSKNKILKYRYLGQLQLNQIKVHSL